MPTNPADMKTHKKSSTRKKENRRKGAGEGAHAQFLRKNWKNIAFSALISMWVGLLATFFVWKVGPILINYVQDGILELMAYLRGTGDKSMMTRSEADAGGGNRKYIYAHDNATYADFSDQYYQREPGLFYGGIIGAAVYKDVMKVVKGGSGKKIIVHDGRKNSAVGSKKSFNEFRKIQTPVVEEEPLGTKLLYMEESSELLPKTVASRGLAKEPSGNMNNWTWLQFDGDVKLASVHKEYGPPFRQGRHLIVEVLEGSLHWAMFHPNAIPTIGFREDEGLREWLGGTSLLVSPLFAPLEAHLTPGQVLYVPEGYFYSYKAQSSPTSFISREVAMEDVGTELYALVEGRKRLALKDYSGAAKLLNMGLEIDLKVASDATRGKHGQGRRSFELLSTLGDTYWLMNDLEKAEYAYRDALSQNARQVKTYAKYMKVVLTRYEKKEVDAKENAEAKECVPWLLEENRLTRRRISSAASLALSSGVLTEELGDFNRTNVMSLEIKKGVCAKKSTVQIEL